MIVSMHRANVAPLDIEAVFSIVSDALTCRALEFATRRGRGSSSTFRMARAREPGPARGRPELGPRQRRGVLER